MSFSRGRKWRSGAKGRKGFSPAQWPALNDYVARAWSAFCRHEGLPPESGARCLRKRCKEPGCRFCGWYEDALEAATGHRTSADCNAWRDYDWFMAALEEIHREGIEWQMRKFRGDANRIIHSIQKVVVDHGIDEDYLRRVAANALREKGGPPPQGLPELHRLPLSLLLLIKNKVLDYVSARSIDGGRVL